MPVSIIELDKPEQSRTLTISESEAKGTRTILVENCDSNTDVALATTLASYPLGSAWDASASGSTAVLSRLMLVQINVDRRPPSDCVVDLIYDTHTDNQIEFEFQCSLDRLTLNRKITNLGSGTSALIPQYEQVTVPATVFSFSIIRTETETTYSSPRNTWWQYAVGNPQSDGSQQQRAEYLLNSTNRTLFFGFNSDTVRFDSFSVREQSDGSFRVRYNFVWRRFEVDGYVHAWEEMLKQDATLVSVLPSRNFGILDLKYRDGSSI